MSKHKTKPAPIDPNDARAAYEAVGPELDALHDRDLAAVRIDPQLAATHANGVAVRDRAPDRQPALQLLVSVGLLPEDPCGVLSRYALATWYARQQQARAASRSQGIVTDTLVKGADERKRRMQKVLGHYFEEHPTIGPELAAIRLGSGHQDLANDLQQLADLYEQPQVHEIVRHDPVHYRASDVADARADAGHIFQALGLESTDAVQWAARVRRAYTLLDAAYVRHCYAGQLLFHRREDVAATYPLSLVSVVRTPPTRRTEPVTPSEPATEPRPVTPADPAQPED